jgi:DNA-binding response OmpR family regulator
VATSNPSRPKIPNRSIWASAPDATPITQRFGSLDGIWIDPTSEVVYINTKPLEPSLSKKQFELLTLLLKSNGSLLTKEEIITNLWPSKWEAIVSNDAVDSLIKRLRRRLNEIDNMSARVEVVRGRGIRLKENRMDQLDSHAS